MQKHVNLVDIIKSFSTNIFVQNLASIQKRTSPTKFAHLAEKSEKGSISNLSTKVDASAPGALADLRAARVLVGVHVEDEDFAGVVRRVVHLAAVRHRALPKSLASSDLTLPVRTSKLFDF